MSAVRLVERPAWELVLALRVRGAEVFPAAARRITAQDARPVTWLIPPTLIPGLGEDRGACWAQTAQATYTFAIKPACGDLAIVSVEAPGRDSRDLMAVLQHFIDGLDRCLEPSSRGISPYERDQIA